MNSNRYVEHSPFSHPREHAALLETLPQTLPELTKAIWGLVIHYRASGLDFPLERMKDIDTRWVFAMLERIRERDPAPLSVAREPLERFVGCCRDFSLLLVAALRGCGIPARARVGFAPYLHPEFRYDHVMAQYWNGTRWVGVDAQLEPQSFEFDPLDMPTGIFLPAHTVWRRYRAGQLDPELYGVSPHLPFRGPLFIRDYVLLELAFLQNCELLLWDRWDAMNESLEQSAPLIDELAAMLEQGDDDALESFVQRHPRMQAAGEMTCHSPTGQTFSWQLESML